MYYQAEGCMNMETITFEEGSQGFIPPGSCFGYFSFIRHIASSKIFAAVFPAGEEFLVGVPVKTIQQP